MKAYLKQLEELLIEENCHTTEDAQKFRKLHELVERDAAMPPKKRGKYGTGCPVCGITVYRAMNTFCTQCGQRLDWKKE